MLIYFFDIFNLGFVIAPAINREFGVLENLQLVIILVILYRAIVGYRTAKDKLGKLIFALLTFFSIFIFLEEMDYGLHIQNLLAGKYAEELQQNTLSSPPRSIHNMGDLTKYIKLTTYIMLVVYFVILPLINRFTDIKNVLLKKIIPSHYFIFTLLSMFVLNRVALYLDKLVQNDQYSSLHANVSEFEEVYIYYIVLLFVVDKSKIFTTK